MIETNPGTRPSKLDLDRYATGELSPEERARIEAGLDDAARAHLAALAEAKRRLPPFDPAALRRRAAALPPDPVQPVAEAPRAANRGFVLGVVLLAVAAIALLVARPFATHGEANGPDTVRFRTGQELQLFELQGRKLFAWEGAPLGEGDVVGFKVVAGEHRGVVVLSVDGEGTVDVFWPEAGDAPEPLAGEGLVPLPGTLVLDDAPGPEVFVAVFDRPVSEARAALERAYRSGGAEAVLAWAEEAPDVDAVEVPRR